MTLFGKGRILKRWNCRRNSEKEIVHFRGVAYNVVIVVMDAVWALGKECCYGYGIGIGTGKVLYDR